VAISAAKIGSLQLRQDLEAAHRDQLTSASEQLETQRQVPRVDVVRRRRWLGRWDEN